MNWYDRGVSPYLIDIACGLPMVQVQRRHLVLQAQPRGGHHRRADGPVSRAVAHRRRQL